MFAGFFILNDELKKIMVTHLSSALSVKIAQRSIAGVKPQNEDCIGVRVPDDYQLTTKGITVAIADGVSAAEAGKEAAEISVQGFISDYYSTPDSWSVKQSAQKVLTALNRWLYGRSQHYIEPQKGFVTTFSALILKSRSAYVFHVGDSRIYRFRDGELEQITHDHVSRVSETQVYLARALGIDLMLDIDFVQLDLEKDDVFICTTDGIHDWITHKEFSRIAATAETIDEMLDALMGAAQGNNSDDNISCQIIRIESLGEEQGEEVYRRLSELVFPPELEPGMVIDGYRVIKPLSVSHRSQVYLVSELESGDRYVMKTPSRNFEDDPAYIERFAMEEWIGQRIDSPHVVKIKTVPQRHFLYILLEYIEGPTLSQYLQRNGPMEVRAAVEMAEQIARGLRAFHRRETLHQDLKPDNIVIRDGIPVIIDFGSVHVAGIDEIDTPYSRDLPLGTLDYAAPEYRLNRSRSERSDQFSLAVILYEMLTGKLPFADRYQKAMSLRDFSCLRYEPAYIHNPHVPVWLDGALQRALSLSADLRYPSLSEFLYDLARPNPAYLGHQGRPLAERNPVLFWQGVSALLLVAQLVTLYWWHSGS